MSVTNTYVPAAAVGEAAARYVVVSTQGRGDEAALLAALAIDVDYVAFVGSRKKAEALKAELAKRGVTAERLAKLKAPAGDAAAAMSLHSFRARIVRSFYRSAEHSPPKDPKPKG